MKRVSYYLFTAVAGAFLIAGCGSDSSGGGGGNNNNSEAEVDDSNKTEIATAASVGARRAIQGNSAPTVFSSTREKLEEATNADTGRQMSRAQIDLGICTSGNAYYTTDGNQSSQFGTFSVVYNNCQYGETGGLGSAVVDGTASWTYNQNGSYSYEYDITTNYSGETTRLTGTYSCDENFNCSYEDDFTENGTSYQVSNASVQGNNSSGYAVSAEVSYDNAGSIDISGSGLVLCNDGESFQSGSIEVKNGSGQTVLSVQFNSCTEMTVTFNGVAETVSQ